MDKLKFGNYIYDKRKAMGLSQEELGYKLGVTNKAVSKWETGETLPDINLIESLAKILNVSIDDQLKQTDTPKQINKTKYLLIGLSALLAITTVCLSTILIIKEINNRPEEEPTVNTYVIDNDTYQDYLSFTPCYKSELNNQTLTIYGDLKINDLYSINKLEVALSFSVHFYYLNTEGKTSLYSYLNRKLTFEITELRQDYHVDLTPNNPINNYSSFIGFDIEFNVDYIHGELQEVIENEENL